MTYSKMVSIFTISTVHILSLVVLIGFSVFIYTKANRCKLLYSFLAVEAAFLIWIIAKIMKTVSPNFELRWFFVVFQYFGICLLEFVFLRFAFNYAEGQNPPRWLNGLVLLVAVLQFGIIASNEYHHLFYSEFTFDTDEFGPLFYIHVGIMYAIIAYGIIRIGIKFRRDYRKDRKYQAVSFAILLPLIANIYYLSGYYHELMHFVNWRSFDITPLAFSLSLGAFGYSIHKKEFLDMMPVFEDEMVRHMNAGVFLLNRNHQLMDINEKGKEYKSQWMGKDYFFEDLHEKDFIIQIEQAYYHYQKRSLKDGKGRPYGYLITLYDVSSYMNLKNEIELQVEELRAVNEELQDKIKIHEHTSRIASGNFVARELHDVLGHSMTIAIKLLEIAKMEYIDKEIGRSVEKLKEAYDIAYKGYGDLKRSIKEELNMEYDIIGLKTEINKLGRVVAVAGVEFNLAMTAYNGLLSEEEYIAIKRFVQESITNSIKHGKATDIKVELDLGSRKRSVAVTDNGKGCSDIVMGNGLIGMRHRVENLGGKLNMENIPGQGFRISLIY